MEPCLEDAEHPVEKAVVASLVLSLSLGFLIASPQLWQAWRYYPRSIRAHASAQQKMALGNIPFRTQLRQLVCPTTEPVDGVFGTEACTFVGLPVLGCVLLAGWSWWWIMLLTSSLLAMGRQTPLFLWTSWLHLRIPARYCYFVSLSLAMLALKGFATLPHLWHVVVLGLQIASLVLTLPRLWPMHPYCQRWERPATAFARPPATVLAGTQGRVSGLPYPLRTGQLTHIRTLGYNGGSQAAWMAAFRDDPDPNGSGAHDWFALHDDSQELDAYGVEYVYTSRPLMGKWRPTTTPHLFRNSHVRLPLISWSRMAEAHETRADRHAV